MSYRVRSASGKTDDTRWFVADDSGLNVTVKLLPEAAGMLPFMGRIYAERLAHLANSGAIPATFRNIAG